MITRAALTVLIVALAACTEGRQYAQAVCTLVDTSGTYADQRHEVADIIRRALLTRMLPGDSLILIRIDGNSFEKANVEGVVTLDHRPSHANQQKLKFAKSVAKLAQRRGGARHTDISGAMMLCGEYLSETGAGLRTIVTFSDLREELPRGTQRQMHQRELLGVKVVAMNVKKLRADNQNPSAYRQRLADWEKRVRQGGAADWRVFLEPERMVDYLDSARN